MGDDVIISAGVKGGDFMTLNVKAELFIFRILYTCSYINSKPT